MQHNITCPHCGEAFTIDEAGYADIVQQVRVACVAEHVQHEARVGAGVAPGRAVDGEQRRRAPAAGPAVQPEHQQAQQREGEHHRGIVLQADAAALHLSSSSARS